VAQAGKDVGQLLSLQKIEMDLYTNGILNELHPGGDDKIDDHLFGLDRAGQTLPVLLFLVADISL
jgi:hypothetical protein